MPRHLARPFALSIPSTWSVPLLAAVALAASRHATAPTVLFEFVGNSPSDFYGLSIDAADFDGDAVNDLVVGAPLDDGAGLVAGQVTVWSGATGSLLER